MPLKLLFLGDSNVGKSCLIKRYIDDVFDNHLSSTICVDFKIKRFIQEDLKLYIWEITSIQDCLSYLKDSDGVFILFDITDRKSFSNVPFYINEINKNNKHIPIILLGTKSECNENRIIVYQDAKNFADSMNMNYFEISSKEDKIDDIQHLFKFMQSEIEKKKKKELSGKKKKKKCSIM
jgi:Ras-related protein Rab-1A